MTDDITHDLDLLDDWLAGKGYGEEAGLVLRALSLIHKQTREIEKLRAALKPFSDMAREWEGQPNRQISMMLSKIRSAAAALKESLNDSP